MNCKLTNASAQQGDRQTFRESLRLINQVRGENLLTTHRLSALYFKQPGMSGRLTTRYHRPTPLNVELKLEGWLENVEGRKTTMRAEMRNGDELTASCDALLIRPKGGLGLKELDANVSATGSE